MLIKYVLLSLTCMLCSPSLLHSSDQDSSDHDGKSDTPVSGRKQRESSLGASRDETEQRAQSQVSVFARYVPACITTFVVATEGYTRYIRSLVVDAIRARNFFQQYTTPASRTCAVTQAVIELDLVIDKKQAEDPLRRQYEVVKFSVSKEARDKGVNLPHDQVLKHIQRLKTTGKKLKKRRMKLVQRMEELKAVQEAQLKALRTDSDTEQE